VALCELPSTREKRIRKASRSRSMCASGSWAHQLQPRVCSAYDEAVVCSSGGDPLGVVGLISRYHTYSHIPDRSKAYHECVAVRILCVAHCVEILEIQAIARFKSGRPHQLTHTHTNYPNDDCPILDACTKLTTHFLTSDNEQRIGQAPITQVSEALVQKRRTRSS
jgi:hypothetical protein